MSIFLGRLEKYWKGQKPQDLSRIEGLYTDETFTIDNMIFSSDEEKNKTFLANWSKKIQQI